MPSKHSRNAGDRHHFTYHEKLKAGHGTIRQRLGSDSQLPFGYCALSMHPAEQPVVSPSGRIYNREHILEYILTKTQELKRQAELYRQQQEKEGEELRQAEAAAQRREVNRFLQLQDSVSTASILTQTVAKATASNTAESTTSSLPSSTARGTTPLLLTDGASVGTKRSVAADSSSVAAVDSDRALDSIVRSDSQSYKQSRRKIIDDTADDEKKEQLRRISPWVPQFTPQAEVRAAYQHSSTSLFAS